MGESRILSIDLGTTKVACMMYCPEYPERTTSDSLEHGAAVNGLPEGYHEQDPEKIIACVETLLSGIPERERAQIRAVALTGQMHSVVLWNETECSNIITWQDRRTSEKGLLETFRASSGRPLADGFAGTTLAFLNAEQKLGTWTACADPADLLALRMTGRWKPVMNSTFADSWGVYDRVAGKWDVRALSTLGIPLDLLPELVPAGMPVGTTANVKGLPDGIPVFPAIGDNQASILGSARNPEEEIFLTIGTGAQFSVVITQEEMDRIRIPDGLEIRPFPDKRFLAVNAPLCGGRGWTWLGKTVNGFLSELGYPSIPEKELLNRLDRMACATDSSGGLRVYPDFSGIRGKNGALGKIEGITLDNLTLPNLAHALIEGIAANLTDPFPAELLKTRKRIVGSGNGVRYCESVRKEIERRTSLPLDMPDIREEAALGAAKYITEQWNRRERNEL